MNNKFNRLTALFVALMIVVSMVPFAAYAAEEPEETYQLEQGTSLELRFVIDSYGIDGDFAFDEGLGLSVGYNGVFDGEIREGYNVFLYTGEKQVPNGELILTVTAENAVVGEEYEIKFTYTAYDDKGIPAEEQVYTWTVKVVERSPEPTNPDPTEPSVDPTEPSVDPTEPSADPTEPGVEPTEPNVEPTEPGVEPTEPGVEPTEPNVKPTEPEAKPTEPNAEPTEPVDSNEPDSNSGAWLIVLLIGLLAAAGVAGAYIYIIKQKNRTDTTPLVNYSIDDDDEPADDGISEEAAVEPVAEAENAAEATAEDEVAAEPIGEEVTETETADTVEPETAESEAEVAENVEASAEPVDEAEAEADEEN